MNDQIVLEKNEYYGDVDDILRALNIPTVYFFDGSHGEYNYIRV
jgi:hypothetical protein